MAKKKYFCMSFTVIMASQKQVGKAIIRLRKLRGLSQEKFALESGIDRRYISDVENGKRNFSFELLLIILMSLLVLFLKLQIRRLHIKVLTS